MEYRRGGYREAIGGYREAIGGDEGQDKWRSVSLLGCPARLLLVGPYYFDVDMVNSPRNVARQLTQRGMVTMVSESSLQALRMLCTERSTVLEGVVQYYFTVWSARPSWM